MEKAIIEFAPNVIRLIEEGIFTKEEVRSFLGLSITPASLGIEKDPA